ncbi:MAG TPA: hypothetical protein VG838_02060 [Opitutaceae bacterium]|nr:hypothetical protein [Opitutaceae bacterium]
MNPHRPSVPFREDPASETYRRLVALHGGAEAAFVALAGGCVQRFLAQNGRPELPQAFLTDYATRLWRVAGAAGWPRPLGDGESGEPGEMPAERAEELAAQVFAGLGSPDRRADLATPTRQLLKACLQPEFRQCRESYREVVEGRCRRQERAKACARISGSHCVDCPYWVALRPEQHAALLEKAWVSGRPAELTEDRAIYLPEDFRLLRIFIRGQIRAG